MSQVELRHLRTLVALRDSGSLVEAGACASDPVGAVPSNERTETRVGCALSLQNPPGSLYQCGNRLLTLADQTLPLVHSAELDLQRLAGGESGRIYMAMSAIAVLSGCSRH